MDRLKKVFLSRAFCILFLAVFVFAGAAGCGLSDTDAAGSKTEKSASGVIKLASEYSSEPYIELNNNKPEFDDSDKTKDAFENYSDLDELGRCGAAYANICREIMPTEKRGSISKIKPSGWQSVQYDCVEGKSLYNRCHLIGFQLAGENANRKNLITGTRFFNVDGMLPFEDMVADYVKGTGNHVLYRVTPVYESENLVAEGVQMEGFSVEDNGQGICFNVFVYNVQPGIVIDYATGDSRLAENGSDKNSFGTKKNAGSTKKGKSNTSSDSDKTSDDNNAIKNGETSGDNKTANSNKSENDNKAQEKNKSSSNEQEYVINTNTGKFHYPECSSVQDMLSKNRENYKGTRQKLIEQGIEPCKRCNP